jgi:hypothetical protein
VHEVVEILESEDEEEEEEVEVEEEVETRVVFGREIAPIRDIPAVGKSI